MLSAMTAFCAVCAQEVLKADAILDEGGCAVHPTCVLVRDARKAPVDDSVNHPKHYTSHPSGVECIAIVEHMGFNLGNAVDAIGCDIDLD